MTEGEVSFVGEVSFEGESLSMGSMTVGGFESVLSVWKVVVVVVCFTRVVVDDDGDGVSSGVGSTLEREDT